MTSLHQAHARVRSAGTELTVLTRAGVIRPYSPRRLAHLVRVLHDFGLGLAGAFGSAAARYPDRTAIIDERGAATYRELDERSNAVADELARSGLGPGDGVALLARNHRGFLVAALGVVKLGADVLLLNTSFAAPQLREVCEREGIGTIVYDEEFAELVDRAGLDAKRILAWVEDAARPPETCDTIEALASRGSPGRRPAPGRVGRTVILTSGTTGTPKGAARGAAHLDVSVGLLERIPLRSGWRCHLAAPMFHFWGLSQLLLGLMLGSTFVLTRHFDPERFLTTLRDHRCHSAVVIPVMLQRVLALPEATQRGCRLPELRVVAASGSALPGDLAVTWMDRFGDNLYNTYGSTEVSLVSVATPADMRAVPGTAGRPAVSTVVRLLDEEERDVPPGEIGRVFAGNSMLFEGYTGGENKDQVGGLMSTGDVGRFDRAGRLVLEGRDDEMIVSGGENVFPREVEDCLASHPGVAEVAAVGVADAEFGQRLRAFVVVADHASPVAEADLKDHVKAHLARYKVPREMVFIDALPRNATGKVLKRELQGGSGS